MALNDDLRYFSYKRRRGQLLTEMGRERRLGNAKKLLHLLKHPVELGTLWFFSDKKNFCQDQKVNTQNNRWLAYCPADVPRVPQTKFPQTVIVFSCVSSEGDVMPPNFFEQGLRLN
uniref:DDE-1 domain-containing protein n=1 Tax=Anopheles maculatus TaxID=74869 RepID=A0A182STD9_9DIPT